MYCTQRNEERSHNERCEWNQPIDSENQENQIKRETEVLWLRLPKQPSKTSSHWSPGIYRRAIGFPTYNIAKYLTTLTQPFIDQTGSIISDSAFFGDIKYIKLSKNDLRMNLDVVSLLAMVTIPLNSWNTVGWHYRFVWTLSDDHLFSVKFRTSWISWRRCQQKITQSIIRQPLHGNIDVKYLIWLTRNQRIGAAM